MTVSAVAAARVSTRASEVSSSPARAGESRATNVDDVERPSTRLALAHAASAPAPLNTPVLVTPPGVSRSPLRSSVGTSSPNRADDVRAVQRRLVALGHDVTADGRYGPGTRDALMAVSTQFLRAEGGNASPSARVVPGSPFAQFLFGAASESTLAPAPLEGVVGPGAANERQDVLRVQRRLAELGFRVQADGNYGVGTERAVRLFASIILGVEQHADAPPRLQASGIVARHLFDAGAPRWVEIPLDGTGWVRSDREGYHWATDSMLQGIQRIGERYNQYLSQNRGAVPFALNDASRVDGTVALIAGRSEHGTHRNGLDIDLRLTRRPNNSGARYGGVTVSSAEYDRETMYAILDAFGSDPMVERILLNDAQILARARAEGKSWASKIGFASGHGNHAHIDFVPPLARDALSGS